MRARPSTVRSKTKDAKRSREELHGRELDEAVFVAVLLLHARVRFPEEGLDVVRAHERVSVDAITDDGAIDERTPAESNPPQVHLGILLNGHEGIEPPNLFERALAHHAGGV